MNTYFRIDMALIAVGIVLLLSIVSAIILYFTFLSKKYEHHFTGFWEVLYDFLSFKTLLLEPILKISYITCSIIVTVLGFVFCFRSFLVGLIIIILGNILLRLTYEFSILFVVVCRNTSDINKKMGNLNKPEVVDSNQIVCPVCGALSTTGTHFCTACGTNLIKD